MLIHATYIAENKHGVPIANNYFAMGNAGVDFFFVLSGFLITHLHLGDIGCREKLIGYARKRLVRIFPIYWASSLAILPVFFLFPGLGQGDETKLSVITSSLLLMPQDRGSPILVAGWSLTHEVMFYAIMALLIAFRGIWIQAIVAIWAVAVFVALCFSVNQIYSFAYPGFNAWMRVLFWPQNFEFILGAAGAWLIRYRPTKVPTRRLALMVLPVAWVLILASGLMPKNLFDIQSGIHVIYFGCLSFLIVLASAVIDRSGGLSDNVRQSSLYRFQEYLGDASYSIYLAHGPVLSVVYKTAGYLNWFNTIPGWLVNCGLLAFVVAACCVFNALIERPLLKYLGRGRKILVPDGADRRGEIR